MTQNLTITGIAGSLRAGSYAHILLGEFARMLPTGTRFETIDIGALPFYNQDLDTENAPEGVASARNMVAASDAVLIVTPEFNHGLPGVLKNTLDWLSRPAFTSAMVGKPVLFATHSPGALGGVRAQAQLRETLSSMLCRLVPLPEIAITHVGQKLAGTRLTDEATEHFTASVIGRFLTAIAQG